MSAHRMAMSIITLILVVAMHPTAASAAEDPMLGKIATDQQREIQWLYWSPLCVEESITSQGNEFLYSYSFLNVNTAHIWHIAVYTTFQPLQPPTPFVEHPIWTAGYMPVSAIHSAYDPSSLDPNLTFGINTWGPEYPNTTDPVNPGETVTGFSYVTTVYDDAPKYYLYETIESGWAQETGYVAAVGQTCDGATPVEHHTWGAIKAVYDD